MMLRRIILAAMVALAACSGSEPAPESASPQTMAVAEPPRSGGSGAAPLDVTLPQIAYVYTLGFRVPPDRLAAIQNAHLALCDRLGQARCQLVGMARDSGEGQRGDASMKLRVATPLARQFSIALEQAAAGNGGRVADTAIEAEDVSKAIVDASARIRQRELLVGRLTEILRTRQGKVAELVEAERSVAQAQEELDQARGWLNELRGRVAYSTFDLSYRSSTVTPGDGDGITDAVADSAASFVAALSTLLVVLIYLLPWAAIALGAGLGWRRWRRGRRIASASPPD